MPDKIITRYLAKLAAMITALLILLLLVVILQMIALGIEEVITVPTPQGPAKDIQKPKELTTQEKMNSSSKKFLPDGTMIFVYSVSKWDDKDKPNTEIFDANNNLIWQGVNFIDSNNKPVWRGVNNTPLPFNEFLEWNEGYGSWASREINRHMVIEPDFSQSLNCVFNKDGNGRKEFWRYSFSKEYFTGYTSDHKIIGYIGLNGFVENKAQVKPFGRLIHWDFQTWGKQLSPPVLWVTDHYVCQVDIPNKKIEVIFKTETSKIIKSCIRNFPESLRRNHFASSTIKYRPGMDFVTEDNIHHLFLQEPQQAFDVPLPKEQPGITTNVAFTATENDVFFLITKYNKADLKTRKRFSGYDEYTSKEHHVQIDLYKLNQNGTLDNVNHYEWTVPGGKWKKPIEPVSKFMPYITAFSPPLYNWVWSKHDVEFSNYYLDNSIPISVISRIVIGTRPLNIPINLLISFAIMGFTFWHALARRTSWAKLILWVILAGLLNLAGLLAYLVLNHTAVVKCSTCGKKRGLEMDNCSRCGSPLPLPQRKPTDLIMAN